MSAVYNYDGITTRLASTDGGSESSRMAMSVYRNAPQEQDRVSDLMGVIPDGLASVLDVGARDGYLSRLLAGRFASVTALDLESPAISHDRITCVKGDVTRLEFPDNSFDVVVCAEVLEHIPPEGLELACSELSRVAGSHVVIGTPYRQDIRVGRTTCQACGRKNPPWGHVNVFDERRLERLFRPLQHVSTTFAGSNRFRTNAIAAWLMDLGGNPWGSYDQEEACIYCGSQIEMPAERSFIQKLSSRLAYLINAAQSYFVSSRPSWIHMVFNKRQ
ncbi:MAG TPA: class I SAM-dependent methyltransferase [Blastocatellia bacterium]|nr:class I SAM-dependent methyltransferase [Blastocatellia bacterium]